jgi:hypothetical protein
MYADDRPANDTSNYFKIVFAVAFVVAFAGLLGGLIYFSEDVANWFSPGPGQSIATYGTKDARIGVVIAVGVVAATCAAMVTAIFAAVASFLETRRLSEDG